MADSTAENPVMPQPAPGSAKPPALDAYIAEYNSLRAEQLVRLQSQSQAFNFMLIILGAAVGAAVTCITKSVDGTSFQPAQIHLLKNALLIICLFLPLIAGPLGFIFFDNEMVIFSIGARLYHGVRPRMNALAAEQQDLDGKEGLLADALKFEGLHSSSINTHRMLSNGRWILFVVPIFLPTLGILFYTIADWKEMRIDSVLYAPLGVIYLLDFIMCVLLIKAIIWSYHKLHP